VKNSTVGVNHSRSIDSTLKTTLRNRDQESNHKTNGSGRARVVVDVSR
jgi:hypothetical protein